MSVAARTERACKLFKAGWPVREIAEELNVQNPAIYKALRRGGVLPAYNPRSMNRVYSPTALKDKAPLPPPVHRDPCPYCGVRNDVGCRHKGEWW